MDAVNAFNMELFSMIDLKPPISRAKMMSVTKSAIKAIKLYKHVVQIVEKFIKKCKPDLKVPGLYVVDSIVRQSRHQFGVDKDVFGPRFIKNFTETFQNLYSCPEDDKTKLVRVLNLWQKNGVFDMDIIQPLLDMGHGSCVSAPSLAGPTCPQPEPQLSVSSASVVAAIPQLPSPDALAAVAQLFKSPHGQELQRMLQSLQQADISLAAAPATITPTQLQMPADQINPYNAHTDNKSSLAEKLLDRFDYDDEPEDAMNKEERNAQMLGIPGNMYNHYPGEMSNMEAGRHHMMGDAGGVQGGGLSNCGSRVPDGFPSSNEAYSQSREISREDRTSRRDSRHKVHGRRSRSGSRSPRRRRSRSSSRSQRIRHRRSNSRSRERRWRSRSRSQDRREREQDRERRQKGLPSMKNQTLSVCSTTLWVGQLDKRTQQSDVMSLLEEFGQIESINMIPPRGCAYIVMVHRQDANTALTKLSRGPYKVNQKPIKIAWALNKGIKAAHKKFWDVEQGVTYIPWSKVKFEELESYREGGMLDAETLSSEWKDALDLNKKPTVNGALENVPADGSVTAHVQVPPVQQAVPMGSPPAFPGPIMLSPASIHAGGPPYAPSGFNPTKLPAAFSPTAAETGVSTEEDMDNGTCSDGGADRQLGSPGAPVMGGPGPAGMQAPGMPPMQHPPGMPPYHQPPNMPHMPPQMMPRGPMYPPDRFRMPMPFPPRGPPFQRPHPMAPQEMDDREERHFQNGRPGFGFPPFQRGRW
ncbi:SR-related and CTD-associated factor 4-like isoform X2 [Genypterus blacodes]|uniref:SR-related and CTD-associated factor 4-like isoform X2 n=1 Tax=Genypterus blacodes TaxID=154954 RepID=UPI003F763C48